MHTPLFTELSLLLFWGPWTGPVEKKNSKDWTDNNSCVSTDPEGQLPPPPSTPTCIQGGPCLPV